MRPLIKTLLASLLLLSGIASQAQTYLNTTNMTVGVVGANDNIMFIKYSGAKYYWNRCNAWDFFSYGTNSPAIQSMWSYMTAYALVASQNASAISTLNTTTSGHTISIAQLNSMTNNLGTQIRNTQTNLLAVSNSVVTLQQTFYPTSNPAGFQNSSQVQAIADASAAAAVSGSIQSNGLASFSSVTANAYFSRLTDLGAVTNANYSTNIDLSLSAYQRFKDYIGVNGVARSINLSLANIVNGANTTVIVQRTDTGYTSPLNVNLPTGTINLISGGATSVSLSAGKTLVLTFLSFGTNASDVVMSAAVTP